MSMSSTDRATSLAMLGLNNLRSLGIMISLLPVAVSDLEGCGPKQSNRLANGIQSLLFGGFITVESGRSIIHDFVEDVKMNPRKSQVVYR
jgi:hypothetical protein